MTLNPRQQALLDLVRRHMTMSVEGLARALKVTPQTVRRDIRLLVKASQLTRYHGGVRLPPSVQNIEYVQRQAMGAHSKRRIGRAVAERLPDDSSLIINIGTTTEEVARALMHHKGLRVVTNNLNVAATLSDNASCEVLIAGGVVRNRDKGIVGDATIDFIRQFKVNVGIIGISSIDPDGSLRDFDAREVRVSQAIIQQSREVWLVADHTKFSRESFVHLGHMRQIDVLFTDRPPSARMAGLLKRLKTEVVVAR
jgi:DeoR family glycerol-3-phosphate regulon repressor